MAKRQGGGVSEDADLMFYTLLIFNLCVCGGRGKCSVSFSLVLVRKFM